MFTLGPNDTIFTITRNNSFIKEGIANVIAKIFSIRDSLDISLDLFSSRLAKININKLYIFSIDANHIGPVNKIGVKGYDILYMEMSVEQFVIFLNDGAKFLEYNKTSLYILKGGNFLDIKNMFNTINGFPVNVGRWRISKVALFKSP